MKTSIADLNIPNTSGEAVDSTESKTIVTNGGGGRWLSSLTP